MSTLDIIANYPGHISYLGAFAVAALAGYLIPLPEEIVLLLVGYGVSAGSFSVGGMMAATILSAMITQGYATDTIHEEAVKHTDKLIDKLNQTL